MYRNFVKEYFSGADMIIDTEEPPGESCNEAERELEPEVEAYVSFIRASAAMGFTIGDTKWNVNGALIDTASTILSLVGILFLPAVEVENKNNVKLKIGKDRRLLNGIGKTVQKVRTVMFYF